MSSNPSGRPYRPTLTFNVRHRMSKVLILRWLLAPVLAIAPIAASPGTPREPFNGEWDGSEHIYLRQVGRNVCGLWRTTATNREYEGRLLATASGNRLVVTKVCGTPGGRSSTYCPDAAPRGETSVGWSDTQETGLLCDGRLLIVEGPAGGCPLPAKVLDWDKPVSPSRSRQLDHQFSAFEVAWAQQCAATPNLSLHRTASPSGELKR